MRNKTGGYLKLAVVVLAAVILCGGSAALLMGKYRADAKERQRIERLNEQAQSVNEEYTSVNALLEKSRRALETLKFQSGRMTMLIFNQCSANLYDQVYNVLKARKLSAVFVISDDGMVGREDCLTTDQYKELIKAGWRPAICAPDTGKDFVEYLMEKRKAFEDLELEFPKVFYFPVGGFEKEIFDAAVSEGFTTVIYCAEDDLAGVSFSEMTDENSLMAVPYMYTSRQTAIWTKYEKRINEGENCSIATGKVIDGSQAMEEDRLMLDTTVSNLKNILDTVTDEIGTYRSFDEYRAERLKSDTEYVQKRKSLEKEILELTERSKELYEQLLALYAG